MQIRVPSMGYMLRNADSQFEIAWVLRRSCTCSPSSPLGPQGYVASERRDGALMADKGTIDSCLLTCWFSSPWSQAVGVFAEKRHDDAHIADDRKRTGGLHLKSI